MNLQIRSIYFIYRTSLLHASCQYQQEKLHNIARIKQLIIYLICKILKYIIKFLPIRQSDILKKMMACIIFVSKLILVFMASGLIFLKCIRHKLINNFLLMLSCQTKNWFKVILKKIKLLNKLISESIFCIIYILHIH